MLNEIFRQLKKRSPLAPLCPSEVWKPELSQDIISASDTQLFGEEASNDEQREMRLACRSGLLLLNDDLKASHEISQQIETPTGSFWHAIMHRREGDFANSGYWWRRTGMHPAFDDVYTEAMSILLSEEDEEAVAFADELERTGTWPPEKFVELCQNAVQGNHEPDWLLRLQRGEMVALFRWCRERA